MGQDEEKIEWPDDEHGPVQKIVEFLATWCSPSVQDITMFA